MTMLNLHYDPEPLSTDQRAGWFDWSLDFFTDPKLLQIPYVDITLQLDVTDAYQRYQAWELNQASFFSFLMWHLMQAINKHPSFKLRKVRGEWYFIHNPPIVVPVAVGGQQRFFEVVIENTMKLSLPDFCAQFHSAVQLARAGQGHRATAEQFFFSTFIGNLPNLQFTGLTLHYRREVIDGQTLFYFGKRYTINERLYIPLAAKLHHATTDPFVLSELIATWQQLMRKSS
jgi:chloramphenicol O-acetyltransferase